ncbi:hypothetical protein RhiirA5_423920 [Rhizophagus irregularis]|uniref:Uncharacterized protein n=1 Tax=Rhizophagus irregularis TaxID=588596 RepID=A0A2I1F2U8_9GLOM|nr:hypothetical protein RhiirA5_423920 [Rhizophagus irregularis]PKY28687.1 hypothetical protein RhiirB3_444974 [Rhizophagus irregularis]
MNTQSVNTVILFHDTDDNTIEYNWLTVIDAFIACIELFFAFRFLKSDIRNNISTHWFLHGSTVFIDCVKTATDLGLGFGSIYRGGMSFILWMILSVIIIIKIKYSEDSLNSLSIFLN